MSSGITIGMSDAAIRAALEAAGEAVFYAMNTGCTDRCDMLPCPCSRDAASAAVAAFLRALPDWHEIPPGRSVSAVYLRALAAAVEAAAGEGGE